MYISIVNDRGEDEVINLSLVVSYHIVTTPNKKCHRLTFNFNDTKYVSTQTYPIEDEIIQAMFDHLNALLEENSQFATIEKIEK